MIVVGTSKFVENPIIEEFAGIIDEFIQYEEYDVLVEFEDKNIISTSEEIYSSLDESYIGRIITIVVYDNYNKIFDEVIKSLKERDFYDSDTFAHIEQLRELYPKVIKEFEKIYGIQEKYFVII